MTTRLDSEQGRDPLLDEILPPPLRREFERRYWRPIEQEAIFERFVDDPEFHRDPHGHVALYADHGVVHVRDVARRTIEMIDSLNGILIAERDSRRLRVVQACGALTAYLHDIGMVSTTPEGRRAHPQFAAREPFRPRFDDLAETIWTADVGGIRSRITGIGTDEPFPYAGPTVLREVLALAMCHSKTAVPMSVFNDPEALRNRLRAAVFDPHPMDDSAQNGPTDAIRWYGGRSSEAFGWLVADSPLQRAFAADVLDSIRVLRAADALRQRGTTLRTSAGYEIFVDHGSGLAVYALRTRDRLQSFYLRVSGDIAAGEANLRMAEVGADGHLSFAFHRGDFEDPQADHAAIRAAAWVVADVWADVVPSFEGAGQVDGLPAPRVGSNDITVVLIASPQTARFADRVSQELARSFPHCAARLRVVAEPSPALRHDLDWGHRGVVVGHGSPAARQVVDALHDIGWRTESIDRSGAFDGVRRVAVEAGETIIIAGSQARCVIIPMQPGLRVNSLGGYRSAPGRAWVPVGVTGVVRNEERNSDIVADAALDIVVIPATVFLRDWFRPYTTADLPELVARMTRALP